MRQFVEGVCELSAARLVYRTFSTGAELGALLEGEAIDNSTGRVILYIACHGEGGRLSLGRRGGERVNLGPLARRMRRGVEGVWLGTCDLGASRSLEDFLTESGAIWAGGYSCAVDWDSTVLLDLAVLQQFTSRSRISTRQGVLNAFGRALRGFEHRWIVGEDESEGNVALANAIRIVARDRRQGARPKDVSDELRRRLKWEI